MTSRLGLLLWLKWTLTWRAYRRSRSQVAGAILFVVFLLPLSGLCAYGVWSLLHDNLPLAYPIARDALAIIALMWVIAPLLGFSLNESFDVTRLFIYPLSTTQIFLGALLGGVLDRGVLLVLPVFGVLLAALCPTPAAFLASLLLLALFLFQTLALGQAVMLLLIGFLRSRRFRDITIVLFPLIGMAYYLGQRLLMRRLETGTVTVPMIVQAPAWQFANRLPPGWAAAGIDAARQGHFGTAWLSLGGLAAATLVAVAVASAALRTLYLGDVGPLQPQQMAMLQKSMPKTGGEQIGMPLLPFDVGAMAWKEWAYFRREPQYKALAVQSAYTLVVLAVSIALPSLRRGLTGFPTGDGLLLGVSGVLLLSVLPLLFNMWAGEGAAITSLFSMPTSRRAMILGKNAAHGILLLGVCAVGLTAVAALAHVWNGLPLAGLWVLLAAPLLLAAGNLVSVRFPHRLLVRGQRWGRGGLASSDGAGSGLAYSALYLLAYAGTLAVLLPVFAAVALPGRWGIPAVWRLVSLPAAAAYSIALYVILLGQAEVWLLAREPEIIARIVPE